MNLNNSQQLYRETLNNIIFREVGSFADEIIKAKSLYYIIDNKHQHIDLDYMKKIKAKPIDNPFIFDVARLTSNDLLIIITRDGINPYFEEMSKDFKQREGRVVAITSNRDAPFLNYTHKVIGVNINLERYEQSTTNPVFQKVTNEIFSIIKQRIDRTNMSFEIAKN